MLVAYRMKPGKYVFTRQLVRIPGYVSYEANPPMAGPKEFEIKAGEVTYAGTHTVRLVGVPTLFNRLRPSATSVSVSDELLADLDLLHSLRPEMRAVRVNNALRR